MKVLVVGGSGAVGRMTVPYLAERFDLAIYDLQDPGQNDGVRVYVGDVTDYPAVEGAVKGCDAMIYMAMGSKQGWNTSPTWEASQFDVNIKGLHTCLVAASAAGCSKVVVASSMSVFADYLDPRQQSEPPSATDVYGLTKRLGEQVARAVAEREGIDVVVLRLVGPMDDESWAVYDDPRYIKVVTSGTDVARAFAAALTHRPEGGFDTFTVAGDFAHASLDLTRTREVLGWVPRSRRRA